MRKTYKYRIYLTNGQRRILNQQLEECRWTYNPLLEAREFAHAHNLTCNRYDLINLLPHLSVRVHACPHCGLVLDRDQNAAINILRLGQENLRL